jgi:hypothetical protein
VIVGDNTAPTGADLNGTATVTEEHSIVEATPAGVTVTDGGGNHNGVDPGLVALAANGGLTRTHALTATSAALDAGDPAFTAPPSVDQRGLPRVAGTAIDIGAFETQPPGTPPPAATPGAAPGAAARAVTASPRFTG